MCVTFSLSVTGELEQAEGRQFWLNRKPPLALSLLWAASFFHSTKKAMTELKDSSLANDLHDGVHDSIRPWKKGLFCLQDLGSQGETLNGTRMSSRTFQSHWESCIQTANFQGPFLTSNDLDRRSCSIVVKVGFCFYFETVVSYHCYST